MRKTASKLDDFRAEKNDFFANDPRSPLYSHQRRLFKGLGYFDENPRLVIKAKIDRRMEPGEVRMETTTGKEQVYRRYGVVRFEADGEAAQVTLFSSDASHELFLPFRDATSGKETYAAGRYLDLHSHGDDIVIDFNYAYNPNCAYDAAWSCPLPPAENYIGRW